MDINSILSQISGYVGNSLDLGRDRPDAPRQPNTAPSTTATSANPKAGSISANPTALENPCSGSVGVIIFSKDRPYQLSQLLRSMRPHVHTIKADDLRLCVLYHSSGERWRAHYEMVKQIFNAWTQCEFVEELETVPAVGLPRTEQCGFSAGLGRCLNRLEQFHCESIMFLVDDLIFYDDINIRWDDLFSVFLKSHHVKFQPTLRILARLILVQLTLPLCAHKVTPWNHLQPSCIQDMHPSCPHLANMDPN